MELLPALKKFNLSHNEGIVYTALLKIGSNTVGPIGTKTKLHRQAVYEVLSRLEQMKLVTVVTKNNRKHYRAADPSFFIEEANRLVQIGTQLTPALKALQVKGSDDLDVYIGRGRAEYLRHLVAFVKSAKEGDGIIRIMGGADDSIPYKVLGSSFDEYQKELDKIKVGKYLVAAEEHSSVFKKRFALEPNTVLKTIAGSLVSPTFTRITHDLMGIEVFGDDVLVIRIQNPSIAMAYRNHFDILWGQGKLFKP